jgi:hypothetical protein
VGEVAGLRALAGAGGSEKREPHAQLRANAPLERDFDRLRKPS